MRPQEMQQHKHLEKEEYNMGLIEQLQAGVTYGLPTKKDRMKAGTPMKQYLKSVFEESIKRQMMETMQAPQLGAQSSSVVEPPTVNPLENALMSMPQQSGGMSSPPEGSPYGS